MREKPGYGDIKTFEAMGNTNKRRLYYKQHCARYIIWQVMMECFTRVHKINYENSQEQDTQKVCEGMYVWALDMQQMQQEMKHGLR